MWPPVLAAWCLPPAIGVLLHGRRVQRWVCLLGAVVTGLTTLVLFAYGVYQVPAVVALGAVVTVTKGRTDSEGSRWLTKIGWIVFALVCVVIAERIVALIVLSPAD